MASKARTSHVARTRLSYRHKIDHLGSCPYLYGSVIYPILGENSRNGSHPPLLSQMIIHNQPPQSFRSAIGTVQDLFWTFVPETGESEKNRAWKGYGRAVCCSGLTDALVQRSRS